MPSFVLAVVLKPKDLSFDISALAATGFEEIAVSEPSSHPAKNARQARIVVSRKDVLSIEFLLFKGRELGQ